MLRRKLELPHPRVDKAQAPASRHAAGAKRSILEKQGKRVRDLEGRKPSHIFPRDSVGVATDASVVADEPAASADLAGPHRLLEGFARDAVEKVAMPKNGFSRERNVETPSATKMNTKSSPAERRRYIGEKPFHNGTPAFAEVDVRFLVQKRREPYPEIGPPCARLQGLTLEPFPSATHGRLAQQADESGSSVPVGKRSAPPGDGLEAFHRGR